MPIQSTYKQIDDNKSILHAYFRAMHARIDLKLCNLSRSDSEKTAQMIYDKIKFLDQIGDRFDPDSDISFINNHAAQFPVWVKPDMLDMISQCIEYNHKTYGAFDITVQSENDYNEGIDNIILNMQDSAVFFTDRNVKIDLCGFIKGFALDKVKQILLGNCTDAFINIGNSSIMALGNHPLNEGWRIKMNYIESNELKKVEIVLDNECLTTSGNLCQGRKHIINPQTREFIEEVKTISVLTKSGAEGEALSTALIAASEEQKNEIINNLPASASLFA